MSVCAINKVRAQNALPLATDQAADQQQTAQEPRFPRREPVSLTKRR
jgi:hypothetical protein